MILRTLGPADADAEAVADRGTALRRYLDEQSEGLRTVIVAEHHGSIAGYVTLLWSADDPVLRKHDIPEISDLWVRPTFRGRGVGSALLDAVERRAGEKSDVAGLNVGLHSGYGAAQRLYVRRGYVPDGSGVVIDGKTVPEGATVQLNDDPIVTLRMTKHVEQGVSDRPQ